MMPLPEKLLAENTLGPSRLLGFRTLRVHTFDSIRLVDQLYLQSRARITPLPVLLRRFLNAQVEGLSISPALLLDGRVYTQSVPWAVSEGASWKPGPINCKRR